MRDYGDTAKDSHCTCLSRAIPDILSCMVGNAKWEGMTPTEVSLIVAWYVHNEDGTIAATMASTQKITEVY